MLIILPYEVILVTVLRPLRTVESLAVVFLKDSFNIGGGVSGL